jgi:hypothetical protein
MTGSFTVSQPLNNVTTSAFNDANSVTAFQMAVSSTMDGVDPTDVTITSVTGTADSSSAKLQLRSALLAAGFTRGHMNIVSAPSVVVGYVVTFNCAGSTTTQLNDMYSSLMTQLNTAVSNGDLTAAIYTQAVSYNATALTTAAATVEPAATAPIVVNYYSPSPTNSPVNVASGSISSALDLGKLSAAVYVVVGLLAIAVAGAVYWKRSLLEQGKLAVLPLVSTGFGLCLEAFTFAANIALAAHFLSSGGSAKLVAVLMLAARVVYVAFNLAAVTWAIKNDSKMLLCPVSLSQNGGILSAVCFLSVFQSEALKYLPWQRSDFTDATAGYAIPWQSRACTSSTVILSISVAVISACALFVAKHVNEQDAAAGTVSLVASLLLVVVACLNKCQLRGILVSSSELGSAINGESGLVSAGVSAQSFVAKEAINSPFQPPNVILSPSSASASTSLHIPGSSNPINQSNSLAVRSIREGSSFGTATSSKSTQSVQQIISGIIQAENNQL